MAELNDALDAQNRAMDIARWFIELIKTMAERDRLNIVEDPALAELKRCAENGKGLGCMYFPTEKIAFLEELMKKEGILYSTFESVDINSEDPDKTTMTYFFKNEDMGKVKEIAEEYLKHLDGDSHELDKDTFEKANEERGYFKLADLTHTEVDVFRQIANEYNFDFSVVKGDKDKDGNLKYTVLANDEKILKECSTRTFSELMGAEGQDYAKKIDEMWKNQFKVLADLNITDKTILIADANSSNKVIEVYGPINNRKYRTHYIETRLSETKSKTKVPIMVDVRVTPERKLDKSIWGYAIKMNSPVIVPDDIAKDFYNIDERGKEGRFVISKENSTPSNKLKVRRELKNKDILPVKKPNNQKDYGRRTLMAYTKLPTVVIAKLESQGKEGVYVKGRDVAFDKELLPYIKQVVKDEFYEGKDIPPLEQIMDDMLFTGRGNVKFEGLEPDEKYVLYDAADPKKKIVLEKDLATIYSTDKDTGEEVSHRYSVTDKVAYPEQITHAIADMRNPISMKKEQYDDPNRYEFEEQILNSAKENKALNSVAAKDHERATAILKAVEEYEKGELKEGDSELYNDAKAISERTKSSIKAKRLHKTYERVEDDEERQYEERTNSRKNKNKGYSK